MYQNLNIDYDLQLFMYKHNQFCKHFSKSHNIIQNFVNFKIIIYNQNIFPNNIIFK